MHNLVQWIEKWYIISSMIYLGFIVRWIVGFSFFFVLSAYVLIGRCFYSSKQLYKIAQRICRGALRACGVRIKVVGLDRFDPHIPYLIIANHESLLDAFICPAYLPMYFTTLELAEHFHWPLWGLIIRRWGHIPIIPGNLRSIYESLKLAKQTLMNGTSLLVFPEGGRTVTGELQPFKKGAFHLAYETKATILPIAIKNLYKAKTRGDWRFRSANVGLIFGGPLKYDVYKSWGKEKLRDWAWQKIKELKSEVYIRE